MTQPHIEPDAKIGDLIGRLTDDSKRLVAGEVRLAKLEIKESTKVGVRGMLWLSMAFGISVIAMVALTIFIAAGVGRLAGGHVYVGALVAGVLEIIVGLWLVRRGVRALGEPPYTLPEARGELKETVSWAANVRNHGRAD